MYEEATAIWNEIITPNYICNRVQREQEHLAEMTLQNVKEFYEVTMFILFLYARVYIYKVHCNSFKD